MSTDTLRGFAAAEVRAEMARQRKSGLELASLLDLSQASASRRVLGQIAFSLDELSVIAEWLAVPVENFIRSAA